MNNNKTQISIHLQLDGWIKIYKDRKEVFTCTPGTDISTISQLMKLANPEIEINITRHNPITEIVPTESGVVQSFQSITQERSEQDDFNADIMRDLMGDEYGKVIDKEIHLYKTRKEAQRDRQPPANMSRKKKKKWFKRFFGKL